jgi:hypothetical protein
MSDITCCICLSEALLPIKLVCNHIFCYLCIKSVKLSACDNCPLCRHPISDDIIDGMTLSDCTELDDGLNIGYHWLYKGNNNGWWKYDKQHNEELEYFYTDYISNKYLGKDEKYKLNIGHMQFDIDFDKMEQINNNGYGRKIMRLKNKEIDNFGDLIKGIAGLSNSNYQ